MGYCVYTLCNELVLDIFICVSDHDDEVRTDAAKSTSY